MTSFVREFVSGYCTPRQPDCRGSSSSPLLHYATASERSTWPVIVEESHYAPWRALAILSEHNLLLYPLSPVLRAHTDIDDDPALSLFDVALGYICCCWLDRHHHQGVLSSSYDVRLRRPREPSIPLRHTKLLAAVNDSLTLETAAAHRFVLCNPPEERPETFCAFRTALLDVLDGDRGRHMQQSLDKCIITPRDQSQGMALAGSTEETTVPSSTQADAPASTAASALPHDDRPSGDTTGAESTGCFPSPSIQPTMKRAETAVARLGSVEAAVGSALGTASLVLSSDAKRFSRSVTSGDTDLSYPSLLRGTTAAATTSYLAADPSSGHFQQRDGASSATSHRRARNASDILRRVWRPLGQTAQDVLVSAWERREREERRQILLEALQQQQQPGAPSTVSAAGLVRDDDVD